LEVSSTIFIEVSSSVRPGLDDYFKTGWEIKFRDGFFEER
jgi:hypothetical protein